MLRLITRMAFIAVVIATSVTVIATARLDVPLLADGVVAWSFVPVMQLLTGLILVRGGGLPVPVALDGYFALHRPWSLWLLGIAVIVLIVPQVPNRIFTLGITAVAPTIWTSRQLADYCRRDLRFPGEVARRRVVLHQCLTASCVCAYVAFGIALWPRLVGMVR